MLAESRQQLILRSQLSRVDDDEGRVGPMLSKKSHFFDSIGPELSFLVHRRATVGME